MYGRPPLPDSVNPDGINCRGKYFDVAIAPAMFNATSAVKTMSSRVENRIATLLSSDRRGTLGGPASRERDSQSGHQTEKHGAKWTKLSGVGGIFSLFCHELTRP